MFNLNVPTNVEKEKDTLGGRTILDSGLYKAVITKAYGTTSKSGAKGLVMSFDIRKADGKVVPFTNTFWVTNRAGSVTYKDKEGKEHFLMGFNQVDSICKGLVHKGLVEISTEPRILPVYDLNQKKEVPTEVQVAVELLGKELALGILKTRENKTTKVGDEYVPTVEEVFTNNIDKIFILKNGTPYTINEIEADSEASFAPKWVEKWKDQVQDKYKPVSSGYSASTTTTTPLDIG